MAAQTVRMARLPAGVSQAKAWWSGGVPPTLCGTKAEPAVQVMKPLPSKQPEAADAAGQQPEAAISSAEKIKSFKMHIGANLSIPTRNARELPMPEQLPSASQQGVVDPFEGLPFRAFAERMGERMLPALEAARAAEREAKLAGRGGADVAELEAFIPPVPHLLPFTRWAAGSTSFRSTFIAEAPKERKKARLSWYHPDDTMVPRDWFRGGLLEDMKYFNPFGLGGGK